MVIKIDETRQILITDDVIFWIKRNVQQNSHAKKLALVWYNFYIVVSIHWKCYCSFRMK